MIFRFGCCYEFQFCAVDSLGQCCGYGIRIVGWDKLPAKAELFAIIVVANAHWVGVVLFCVLVAKALSVRWVEGECCRRGVAEGDLFLGYLNAIFVNFGQNC